ncbi:MAG TPA: hypothetical protein VGT24_01105 [Candidatus Acidoferrales bacterium]|nr:hypothetical protein [Candidatus Acidoferrales bacterium]
MGKPSPFPFALRILIFSLALAVSWMSGSPAFGQESAQQPQGRHPSHPRTPMPGNPGAASNAAQAPSPAPSVPITTTSWTAIGPSALATTTVADSTTYVSGRIAGIAADPTTANTIYVAPAGGGVWKTTDGGTTWTPLTDSQSTLSMGAIAVAPSNPSIVYAGTGEANNSLDSNYGGGILTSTDGGTTWNLHSGPSNAFSRLSTAQIAVDPGSPNIAYAAMAISGNNGLGGNTGIWKTTDGGTTWTNTTATITSSFSWTAVVVDPNTTGSTATVYAAVGDFRGNGANGVYKSTNGGTTWSAVLTNAPNGSAAGRIAIAISKAANPANPSVVYVVAALPYPGGLYQMKRSDDAGMTFTDLTAAVTTVAPNFLGGQGWYDIVIAVDPLNSANVYAAGVVNYNDGFGGKTGAVIRSTTSGASWFDITTLTGGEPHTDDHAMAFDANDKLLLGNDGGIWRYDSTVSSWTDLNNNLDTIQFQGIGLHPTDLNTAIAGSQDNGTELFSGNINWLETDGGDGGFAKFSSTNGSRAYHQAPVASFGNNFFNRSDNGGMAPWSSVTVNNNTFFFDTTQNFYAPFTVDPTNGDHVLYGTAQVWETPDGGNSWSTIGSAGFAGFNPSGNNIDSIAFAPSDPNNTIYAATGGEFAFGSQIFVTTNHGVSWTEHDLPVGGRVNEIQVDPSNNQIAYAVISQFNGLSGQVYKTTTGGSSWSNISGDLPSEPVWSLQIDTSTSPNRLFVGADEAFTPALTEE